MSVHLCLTRAASTVRSVQGRDYAGTWTQGDTVGCGIIYSVKRPGTGSIFFTKNGEYLGECRSGGALVRAGLGGGSLDGRVLA